MIKNFTQRHGDTERIGRTYFLFAAAALCLCGLLLGGCQRKIKEANLNMLKPDMTTKEVESILGAPNRIESSPELVSHEVKTLPVTRYVYEQNGEKVELLFVGDKLGSGSTVSGTAVVSSGGHVFKKSITPAITGTFSK